MKSPRFVRATATVLLLALFGSGCSSFPFRKKTPPTSTVSVSFTPAPAPAAEALDTSLLQRPTAEYRLGPGDQLDVEILGDIDTRTTTTVGPDGKIYFYILPGVDVWGLTIPQAREKIVAALQEYVRERQPVSISLRLAESQRVWVLGRLAKPGVYPLSGPTTLLEAIAQAGGLSARSAMSSLGGPIATASRSGVGGDEAADLSRAFVLRQGQLLRVDFNRLLREGDISQNIYLQPDDFVYLPARRGGSVHVLGAVFTPRAVEASGRTTLVQAVAEAGGSIKDAHLSQVAIVRGSLNQPKVAIVDLQAILRGQAPDVTLEEQDIVYVPFTPYRTLVRYMDIILSTFVRTIGVNEGARAISREVAPVGVNVPISGL